MESRPFIEEVSIEHLIRRYSHELEGYEIEAKYWLELANKTKELVALLESKRP